MPHFKDVQFSHFKGLDRKNCLLASIAGGSIRSFVPRPHKPLGGPADDASVFFSSFRGSVGTILTTAVILWCSWSASKLFVTVLAMDSQQLLVAYPCALVYGVFALLTVF